MSAIMLQVLLGIFLVNSGLANPFYQPKNIPNCTKQMNAFGVMICSYNLEELKKVYKADAALTALLKEKPLLDQKIKSLNLVIDKQRLQFELSRNSSELLIKRNKALTDELLRTDRELQEEKVKPKWGNYVLWAVVIGLASGFASYVIADIISDRKSKDGVPTHP